MTNIQRVGMINSNNTQRNSDHDFTKLRKRILGNQGGVESKEQFIFDNDTKKLSAGSDIATAYILCTRPASNPIPNQKFLAQFEFTGSLDFLNITNGDKIFIEIKENLVNDPTLIEDLDSQTSYNQGLGIGEIKMAKNYPSHSNYLKLYEWNEGKLVDLRKAISLPALDEVAQRTASLEQQGAQSAALLDQIEEGISSDHIGFSLRAGENIQANDSVFAQKLRDKSEYTIEAKIGYSTDESAPQIQLISNGKAITHIDLKLSKVGDPTYGLICNLYEAEEISGAIPSRKQKGAVLASGQFEAINTNTEVVRVNFSSPIRRPKGTKLVAVIDTVGSVRSSVNYYQLWCHGAQLSEIIRFGYQTASSFVSKNLMPYVDGEGFYTGFLVKNEENKTLKISLNQEIKKITQDPFGKVDYVDTIFNIHTFEEDGEYELFMDFTDNFDSARFGLNIRSGILGNDWGDMNTVSNNYRISFTAQKGATLSAKINAWNPRNYLQFRAITITQKAKILKKADSMRALARKGAEFGAVAEATLMGIHSDHQWLSIPRKKLVIEKTLSGFVNTTREAPSDGLVEVSWSCVINNNGEMTTCSLNGKQLGYAQDRPTSNITQSKGYGWFFVSKGTVALLTNTHHRLTDYPPSLTLHSFIPL